MKKNRKKIYISIFILILALIVININIAQAASVLKLMEETGKAALYEVSDDKKLQPYYLVGNIVKTFLSLLGIFFMGLAVYGGFLWMSARGDSEQVQKARDILRDAIIGLVIIIAAYAIAYFVLFYIASNYIKGGGGF